MLEIIMSVAAVEAAARLLANIEELEDPEMFAESGLTISQVNEVYDLKTKLERMLNEETDLHIMSKDD